MDGDRLVERGEKESKKRSEKGMIKNIPLYIYELAFLLSQMIEGRITSHGPSSHQMISGKTGCKIIFFICGGFAQGQLRVRTAHFNYEECLLKDI